MILRTTPPFTSTSGPLLRIVLLASSLLFFAAACAFVGAYFWTREPVLWAPGLLFSGMGAMLSSIFLRTFYEISESGLLLRMGIAGFRSRVLA